MPNRIANAKSIIEFLATKYTIDILVYIDKKNGAIWTEIRDAVADKKKEATISIKLRELTDKGYIKKDYLVRKQKVGYLIDAKGKEILRFIKGLPKWEKRKKTSSRGGTKDLSKFS